MTDIDHAEAMTIARAEDLTIRYTDLTATERAYRDDMARERAKEKDGAYYRVNTYDPGAGGTVEADGVTYFPPDGFRPLWDGAPLDGATVRVWCPPSHGLPELEADCAYHSDAGFCVDELREPTHWKPIESIMPENALR